MPYGNMSAGEKLLTAKDLQRILNCGKNRAYELIHSSGFPSIRICDRYYFTLSALDQWLQTYTGRAYLL